MTATFRAVAELRQAVAGWRQAGETIGLVPTMGALHRGHLALVDRSRSGNRRTIATIFVNPTQFAPTEDLAAYPRDEAADLALLENQGVDALFAPAATTMYPPGFATVVSVGGLTEQLCGPHRPGHFAGVATVVCKLLLQAMPDAAYFGEKDFQQLRVVRRMATDLDIAARIVGVPTVRDADGLALSSRNRYLTATERSSAAGLPRALRQTAARIGERPDAITAALAEGRAALARAGFRKIDYFELCDEATLQPVRIIDGPARLFAAAWLGRTRLIDNMPVGAG